jgi:hypothetical protein
MGRLYLFYYWVRYYYLRKFSQEILFFVALGGCRDNGIPAILIRFAH